MKVEVWILLRNREAKRKKTRENKKIMTMNQGVYVMNRNAINFYRTDDKPKGVETFFYEGNPAPIKIEKAGKDTSIDFLDRYIYENVIEQTGDIPKERIAGAFRWVRNNVTLGAFIKWGFVLLIVGSMLRGALNI